MTVAVISNSSREYLSTVDVGCVDLKTDKWWRVVAKLIEK